MGRTRPAKPPLRRMPKPWPRESARHSTHSEVARRSISLTESRSKLRPSHHRTRQLHRTSSTHLHVPSIGSTRTGHPIARDTRRTTPPKAHPPARALAAEDSAGPTDPVPLLPPPSSHARKQTPSGRRLLPPRRPQPGSLRRASCNHSLHSKTNGAARECPPPRRRASSASRARCWRGTCSRGGRLTTAGGARNTSPLKQSELRDPSEEGTDTG
jgi:hypothetical protein